VIRSERFPPDTPVFDVPDRLEWILHRDLKAAGIPKRDDRGRTIDVHAMRTIFGTLTSRAGVAPRTAQAAMPHSVIKLTMGPTRTRGCSTSEAPRQNCRSRPEVTRRLPMPVG
jgi:hypothetical protein